MKCTACGGKGYNSFVQSTGVVNISCSICQGRGITQSCEQNIQIKIEEAVDRAWELNGERG